MCSSFAGWSSIPIIVISARTQEKEKVAALDSGADDYITKPFGTFELLARIRTAIRHNNKIVDDPVNANRPYSAGGLKIDFEKRPPYFEVSPTHKARTWLLDPRAPKVEPPEGIRKLKELGGEIHGAE